MKVLKFYADWCGPCKALTRTLDAGYKGNVPIEQINIDTDTDTASRFGIRGVPTLILMDDTGTELRRKVGMMTLEQFNEFVGV